MWKRRAEVEKVVNRSLGSMKEILDGLKAVHESNDSLAKRINVKNERLTKELVENNAELANAVKLVREYIQYFKSIEVVEKENVKTTEETVDELMTRVDSIEASMSEVKDSIKKDIIEDKQNDLAALKQSIDKVLSLVNENIDSVVVSKKIKQKQGRQSTVNDDLLLTLWNSGNTQLTNEEIGSQVGLTGAGVAARLKLLVGYNGKRKDYGIKRSDT